MTPAIPAIVASKGKVSLADHLDLRNLPLATTPGGTNFAMKALHPSEHTIKSARVPGGNRMSVALCCDMIETIPLADPSLRMEIVQMPSILTPASVHVMNPATGASVFNANFYNAAFAGTYVRNPNAADTQAILNNMKGKIEEFRITSQSITAELIAPALSDQGTVLSAQYTLAPRTTQISDYTSESNRQVYDIAPDVIVYGRPVLPSQSVLGSSAYSSKAREGVYQPLKLTKLKWHSFNDWAVYYGVQDSSLLSGDVINTFSTVSQDFPYSENRTGVTRFSSLVVPKFCGHNFGITIFEGMAADVAVRIRVRQVVEITAKPGTTYAPLLEVALPPDPTALRMYSEISARMADGYPASYNDLGKLKDLILGIGKKVLPYVEPALNFVSKLPGPVGTVASVASSVMPQLKSGAQAVKTVVKAAKAARKGKLPNGGQNPFLPARPVGSRPVK